MKTTNVIKLKYCGKDFVIEIYPHNSLRIIGNYDMDTMKYYYMRVRNYLINEGFIEQ